jgi:hypothetical protein
VAHDEAATPLAPVDESIETDREGVLGCKIVTESAEMTERGSRT